MIEKYGRVRVRQIVSHFYREVLRSGRLARYFENVDVHGLMAHQSAFLAMVMGGPHSHGVDEIEAAHRDLDVDPGDFDEMLRLLDSSLRKFGVEDEDIDVLVERYQGFRSAVVQPG